jgi:hypothetical protein
LILAGSVCFIWQFVLVQTYARVGLYQCSTVYLSWLARKHKKPNNSLFSGYQKNSYCRTSLKNYFFRSVSRLRQLFFLGPRFGNITTMDPVRHVLYRRP